MSCDKRCFEKNWKYGDIMCSDCPGQDCITMERRKELQEKLDASLEKEVGRKKK